MINLALILNYNERLKKRQVLNLDGEEAYIQEILAVFSFQFRQTQCIQTYRTYVKGNVNNRRIWGWEGKGRNNRFWMPEQTMSTRQEDKGDIFTRFKGQIKEVGVVTIDSPCHSAMCLNRTDLGS